MSNPSSREYEINCIAPIILSTLSEASLADKAEIETLKLANRRANQLIEYEANERAKSEISLRAENQRLREALKPFAEPHKMGDNYVQFAPRLIQAARAVLSDSAGEGKK